MLSVTCLLTILEKDHISRIMFKGTKNNTRNSVTIDNYPQKVMSSGTRCQTHFIIF